MTTNRIVPIMGSLELAKLIERDHDFLVWDIEKMLEKLGIDSREERYTRSYIDEDDRAQGEFVLDLELAECLIWHCDRPSKVRVRRRFREIEQSMQK